MTLFSTEAAVYAKFVSSMLPAARSRCSTRTTTTGGNIFEASRLSWRGSTPRPKSWLRPPYEVTSPTADSQVVSLASTNANVFLNVSTGKFTAQAIRKAGEIGWHAQQFLPIGSNFVATILRPAGLEYSKAAISATPTKTVAIPTRQRIPPISSGSTS
jgi:branched-chain amino acid transport system substrate-binding protein